MFRRFLFLIVGSLALLVVLEAPGQLHAQHMRGGMHSGSRMGMTPGFRGRFEPRFNRGFFSPGFNRGFFSPGFNRGFFSPRFDSRFGLGRFERFEDRFGNRSPFGRFDRFEDRVENRLNRAFFNPFFVPGFGF